MCCKSSYNQKLKIQKVLKNVFLTQGLSLSNMFPLSLAEVKYQYKNATKVDLGFFLEKKIKHFFFLLEKLLNFQRERKKPC